MGEMGWHKKTGKNNQGKNNMKWFKESQPKKRKAFKEHNTDNKVASQVGNY